MRGSGQCEAPCQSRAAGSAFGQDRIGGGHFEDFLDKFHVPNVFNATTVDLPGSRKKNFIQFSDIFNVFIAFRRRRINLSVVTYLTFKAIGLFIYVGYLFAEN